VPLLRLHATLGDTEEVFDWLEVARALGIEHILDDILAGSE
jgi:hypothetical protein